MTLCRIIDLSPLSNKLHLIILLMFTLSFHGCASIKEVVDKLPLHIHPENRIERNDFFVAKQDDVIGRLAAIRLKRGDTLPDIARHFSLGINTVNAANPGIDIWVPQAGERILLPLSFILPDTRRKGIVINLAAMRLFYFKADGKQLAVLLRENSRKRNSFLILSDDEGSNWNEPRELPGSLTGEDEKMFW